MKLVFRIFVFIPFLIVPHYCFAQSPGIYQTPNDFIEKKVKFKKENGKKFKIHFYEGQPEHALTVQIGDSSFHFSKDSVYGYIDKQQDSYRIYNRVNFKILNPTQTLLIYAREHLGGYKNTQLITDYFFSKTPSSPIHVLDLHQLKLAFAESARFRELLDINFVNDQELIEFNNKTGLFKLNEIEAKANKD